MHGLFIKFYISFILVIFRCEVSNMVVLVEDKVIAEFFRTKLKHINALECEFAHM